MGSIIKTNNNQLISYIHKGNGMIPKPFEKDIYLFTTYVYGIEETAAITELHNNDYLYLYREPHNELDNRTIIIKTKSGSKIGYIPKHDNQIISRLMDAGKKLYGIVSDISGGVYKIKYRIIIDVYLKD